MKYSSFRTKLFLGFSALILLSVAVAITTTIYITQFRLDTEVLFKHPLKVSNAVRDINSDIHMIHKTMKDIAMLEDISGIDAKLKIVDFHHKKTLRNFEIIYKQYLGGKSDIDAAYTCYLDWEPIRREVIELKKSNNDKDAAQITVGKGALHVNLIITQMQRLADFAENKANELYSESQKKEQKAFFNLYLLLAIIIIVSISLSIILSNMLSKPIRRFTNEMKDVFKTNNLTTNISGKENESILLDLTKKNTITLINTLN